MSGYGKHIAYLATIGVVISLGIGLGIYYSNPAGILDHSTASTNTTYGPITSPQSSTTTSSSGIAESSETACIPSSGYISTTTLVEDSSTTTLQEVYDGTPCNFGNSYFEPPSAILISANTLIWTDFQLQVNGSYYVGSSFQFLSLPGSLGANITVAVYLNGYLSGSSTTPITQGPNEVTNTSLMPPPNSTANSIFALTGLTATGGASTQSGSKLNLTGSTISIAFVSDKPVWLCGWTPDDTSKGTGAQFGQSMGQLKGTHEWPDSGLTLPGSLPQSTTTESFELQVLGDYLA